MAENTVHTEITGDAGPIKEELASATAAVKAHAAETVAATEAGTAATAESVSVTEAAAAATLEDAAATTAATDATIKATEATVANTGAQAAAVGGLKDVASSIKAPLAGINALRTAVLSVTRAFFGWFSIIGLVAGAIAGIGRGLQSFAGWLSGSTNAMKGATEQSAKYHAGLLKIIEAADKAKLSPPIDIGSLREAAAQLEIIIPRLDKLRADIASGNIGTPATGSLAAAKKELEELENKERMFRARINQAGSRGERQKEESKQEEAELADFIRQLDDAVVRARIEKERTAHDAEMERIRQRGALEREEAERNAQADRDRRELEWRDFVDMGKRAAAEVAKAQAEEYRKEMRAAVRDIARAQAAEFGAAGITTTTRNITTQLDAILAQLRASN